MNFHIIGIALLVAWFAFRFVKLFLRVGKRKRGSASSSATGRSNAYSDLNHHDLFEQKKVDLPATPAVTMLNPTTGFSIEEGTLIDAGGNLFNQDINS